MIRFTHNNTNQTGYIHTGQHSGNGPDLPGLL